MIEKFNLNIKDNKDKFINFLNTQDLSYDDKIDTCLVIIDNNKIVASACKDQNIFKMIVVACSHQSNNYVNSLISELINIAYQEKYYHYFIYTKKIYAYIFENLGFKTIASYNEIALLEKGNTSLDSYINNIKQQIPNVNNIGSIVMNANPFTLGHQYLVDKALEKVDYLIIFVVEEDKSYFKYQDRLNLIKLALKEYQNVLIVGSGPYIISNATFPTYFLKEDSDVNEYYTNVDINIFSYIMNVLNIKYRFVGSEPLDQVTNYYNSQLLKVLKEKLIILDRLEYNNKVVSASLVIKYINEKNYDLIKDIVPISTYNFIIKGVSK